MRGRRLPGIALATALLATSPGPLPAAERPAAGAPAEVTLARFPGAERLDAILPGVLLGVTALPVGEGFTPGRLLLLVGGEGDPDAPGSLYRLDLEGKLEGLVSGLPAGGKALEVMDLDGDGTGELLLGRLGDLFTLGPLDHLGEAPARYLLSHPGFDLRSLSPGLLRVARGERRQIAAAEVGVVRLYRPDGQGGIRLARELALPVEAARERTGLRLSSPPAVPLGAGPGEPRLLAAGPQAYGRQRLRTVLLDPASEGRGGTESWSLLPAPEAVEQSWYARVDGRPVLFVATQSADKIGIFEKRRLRAFPLSTDRTREGRRPSLEVETESQRWFELDLQVRDLDGDGRDDLLLIQPEGLGGGDLLLERFPGIGSGRFLVRTDKTKLNVRADRWSFGGDVDGDGRPDLVVLTEDGALALYPGSPSRRRLVEKSPCWTLPLPRVAAAADGESGEEGGEGHPLAVDLLEVLDLDGDGRDEVLLLRSDLDGRGRLVLMRFGG